MKLNRTEINTKTDQISISYTFWKRPLKLHYAISKIYQINTAPLIKDYKWKKNSN